tara:strand:+ start:333 stop:776 length:444 start_codon:yes stop_codon:yes gene_type:complete
MELTNDQQISLLLLQFIPIEPIRYKIIQIKNKKEKQEALEYHTERWETISSKYFRSIEKSSRPYSYVVDNKYYISEKDRCLEFYNETGISYQVRSLLLEILKCAFELDGWMKPYSEHILNCNWYEWREEDDAIYSILSEEIMKKFKE